MNHPITVRIAAGETEAAEFWPALYAYFDRDILDPASPDRAGERAYFLGPEYRENLEALRRRPTDPLFFLNFIRNGIIIGRSAAVIYGSEDGKCFILEFWVEPEHRGLGTGSACARALMDWAAARGGTYFELNAAREDRRRFWARLGFVPNGLDMWGEPLMLLPPAAPPPLTAAPLPRDRPEADWAEALFRLQNSFRAEVGEAPLSSGEKARLTRAVQDGSITFFLLRQGLRPVGACSVSTLFSTFGCAPMAVFEDFYTEPVLRHTGGARLLARAAQDWCRAQGVSSLWVGCAPCDRGMYEALGFTLPLGELLAWNDVSSR